MQFMEAAKKAGLFKKDYAAMVVIAPENEEYFLAEFSQAGGALVDWKAQRKTSGKDVVFTVVCNPEMNDWIKSTMISAFANTPALIEVSRETSVEVSILNSGQAPAEQFVV